MIQILRHHVSPDYFETMGAELVEGRPFRSSDGFGTASVVVVSEELAREVWPDGNALGQRMKFGPEESTAPWMNVVGVVEDIEQRGLVGEPGPGPDVYIPFAQAPPRFPSLMNVLVRSDLDATALVGPLRDGVEERAPSLALYDVQPMSRRLDEQTAQERFLALLLSIFAGLALVLSAIGVYGLTAYTVGRRTRELGLRMALGADARSVVGLVTRSGAVLGALGVAVGLVAVVALTRVLESRLHGVSATDPLTLALAALSLFVVAVVAAWLPARRAARVDPMITLREE
jgi:predicted permease